MPTSKAPPGLGKRRGEMAAGGDPEAKHSTIELMGADVHGPLGQGKP